MDRRLHDEAQRLLRRRIEQLKAAGQWQDPPSLTPRTGLGGAVEGQGEGQGDDSVDGVRCDVESLIERSVWRKRAWTGAGLFYQIYDTAEETWARTDGVLFYMYTFLLASFPSFF